MSLDLGLVRGVAFPSPLSLVLSLVLSRSTPLRGGEEEKRDSDLYFHVPSDVIGRQLPSPRSRSRRLSSSLSLVLSLSCSLSYYSLAHRVPEVDLLVLVVLVLDRADVEQRLVRQHEAWITMRESCGGVAQTVPSSPAAAHCKP